MNRVQPKHKPSPATAFLLRKAIAEDEAVEVFADTHKDRYERALGILASYYDGALTREQAAMQMFSIHDDTALDQWGDQIPEEEYNAAIMPGFMFKRQAS